MVYKRCAEKGCKTTPRCEHNWIIEVKHKGVREKGPATKYAHLLEGHQKLPVTKKEAEILEAQVLTWVAKGRPAPTTPNGGGSGTLTVGEVITKYSARNKDLTAKSILKYLNEDFGTRPLTALLDSDTIADYRDAIVEEDLSECTANRYLAYISILLNFAMSRPEWNFNGKLPFYHRTRNPYGVKRFPETNRTRRMDGDEETKVTDAIATATPSGAGPAEVRQMQGRFYCAIETGLRRGEMMKLQRDDVLWKHPDGLMLRVKAVNAKSRKERLVPVISKRLRAFLEERRIFVHPFGAADGSYVKAFHRTWDSIREAAGMPDLHWHDLRHECGSRWAEGWNGNKPVPLHEIQMLLGHSTLAMTQKYLNAKLGSLATNMKAAMGV